MNTRYSTLVLFAARKERAVGKPRVFLSVLDQVVARLRAANFALKCRGEFVAGPKPRGGQFSNLVGRRWAEALNENFLSFEVFDAAWSNSEPPRVYAAIGSVPPVPAIPGRTSPGEDYVVVAVEETALPESFLELRNLARQLAGEIELLVGFMEKDVGWDKPHPTLAPFRTYLIDVRWHDLSGAYVKSSSSFTERIPHPFFGNILSKAHLKVPIQSIPAAVVAYREEWDGHTFLELAQDPDKDEGIRRAAAEFMNVISTE